MTKTLKQLRESLKNKMTETPSGGWKNPFEEKENGLYDYKSRAVDAAVKYFLAKTLGEERRVKILGKEWKDIV